MRSNSKSMLTRGVGIVLAGASLMVLSACEKKAEGQVVSVVNGDEVTIRELNAELATMQVPEGEAKEEARSRALENIVTRRLMAEAARKQGLDTDPEFVIRRKQLEEALLVQMLAQGAAKKVVEPTPQAIRSFVAENPQMFAQRNILTVDQITFPTPPRNDYIEQLKPAKTMAQVVATLNRLGIRFQRGTVQIDSASVPREMYRQIVAVNNREPFVVPGTGGVAVSQILSSQSAPVPADQVDQVASNMIRQTNIAKQLDDQIKAERASAKIVYQPGYAAPKAAATGAASGSATGSAGAPPAQ